MPEVSTSADVSAARTPTETIAALTENIQRVIIGKSEAVSRAIVALLARGHVLIEDVPGVGKTTLARALATSIDCTFQRVQFTPDLLPSDILGVSVYNNQTHEFSFRRGPIFANVVLADEINRTTPRTQSALLEAMNDGSVSIDGTTHALPDPFLVIATQNPVEYAGTYPLPESQLDRFLLRIEMGYPNRDDERRILDAQHLEHPLDALEAVVTHDDVLVAQRAVREVRVEESVVEYILDIVRRTREHDRLIAGVSPRGSLALRRAVQAHALVQGRDFVTPDDVKGLAEAVCAHRIIEKASFERGGTGGAAHLIREILDDLAVPV